MKRNRANLRRILVSYRATAVFPTENTLRHLTHFMPLFFFDSPWTRQKSSGYLIFSRVIKRNQWHKKSLICKPKDWLTTEPNGNSVQEINYINYQAVYFDELKRSLKTQSNEYMKLVKSFGMRKKKANVVNFNSSDISIRQYHEAPEEKDCVFK